LRVCREFGCLPKDIEELTDGEFLELATFLKMCDDAEREAYRKAEQESKSKMRRR